LNLEDDIRSITDLKTQSAAIINAVNTHHRPTVITQNGRARAVVQDIQCYEATRKALLILKMIAQGESDAHKGRVVKQRDLFGRIDKQLRSRRG
jgi:prevent-host-death family protein